MTKRKIPKVLKWLYVKLLRPWIFKQIDNPQVSWDNVVMIKLDELFMYKP